MLWQTHRLILARSSCTSQSPRANRPLLVQGSQTSRSQRAGSSFGFSLKSILPLFQRNCRICFPRWKARILATHLDSRLALLGAMGNWQGGRHTPGTSAGGTIIPYSCHSRSTLILWCVSSGTGSCPLARQMCTDGLPEPKILIADVGGSGCAHLWESRACRLWPRFPSGFSNFSEWSE